jgi:hypothetical protein
VLQMMQGSAFYLCKLEASSGFLCELHEGWRPLVEAVAERGDNKKAGSG